MVFHRPPLRQQFLKDILGQLHAWLPASHHQLVHPPNPPSQSNLRTHTALTTAPLCLRSPGGFLFPTAESLHSALKASGSLASGPAPAPLPTAPVHSPQQTLHSSPTCSARSPPCLCICYVSSLECSFLPSISRSNKLLLSFQYQMEPSLGMPLFLDPSGLTYIAGSGRVEENGFGQ